MRQEMKILGKYNIFILNQKVGRLIVKEGYAGV